MGNLNHIPSPSLSAKTSLKANTPTGNFNIFTLTGSIRILAIIGQVQTTEMAVAQTRLKLYAQSDALTATDICAALDCTGDAVGTTYNITGTLADALVAVTNGVAIAQAGYIVVPVISTGLIAVNNADAANAGQVFWSLLYEPMVPGARALAAF